MLFHNELDMVLVTQMWFVTLSVRLYIINFMHSLRRNKRPNMVVWEHRFR